MAAKVQNNDMGQSFHIPPINLSLQYPQPITPTELNRCHQTYQGQSSMFSLCGERGFQEDTSISNQCCNFHGRPILNEKGNKFHVHIKQGKLVLHLHCLGNFKGSVQV